MIVILLVAKNTCIIKVPDSKLIRDFLSLDLTDAFNNMNNRKLSHLQNRNVLFVILGLAVSVLIGIYYLLFNDHLWITASSHAYALIGFVIADGIFLAFLTRNNTRIGFTGALAIASIQSVAMIIDIYSYQDIPFFSVTDSNFEDMLEHTYGTWSFDVLLAAQIWIVICSVMGLRRTGIETKPTRRQALTIPVVLIGTAVLLIIFPLEPIYEKESWVYVHGLGWQAPESFRNKEIRLADQFLAPNGTMILKQTHPLYVEGTIYMKMPCTEDAKSLVTIYAGTKIYPNVLILDYTRHDSDPPIYCSFNAKFPQGDYLVNFIGLENTSNEPIMFSPEHSISIKLTKVEGEVPAHPNFGK
jgi:hypothetical protein